MDTTGSDQASVDATAKVRKSLGIVITDALAAGMRFTLATSTEAIALFTPLLTGLAHEKLCVAHIDREGALLGLSEACGLRDEVDLPIRAIARDAVLFDTRGIILAHNHPSGDPTPSRGDLCATRRLGDALAMLDIRIVDHLVMADGSWRSFRALGLL